MWTGAKESWFCGHTCRKPALLMPEIVIVNTFFREVPSHPRQCHSHDLCFSNCRLSPISGIHILKETGLVRVQKTDVRGVRFAKSCSGEIPFGFCVQMCVSLSGSVK